MWNRRREAILPTIAIGLGGLISLTACGAGNDPFSPAQQEPITTVTELRRATAAELDIRLDPEGRPYDAPILEGREGTTLEFEAIGELHVPDGQLRVMDGIALVVDPSGDRQRVPVDFSSERLTAGIYWEVWPEGTTTGPTAVEGTTRGVLGVRIQVPGTEVARWGALEPAYGTDGGMGAVTSQSTVDAASRSWDYPAREREMLEGPYVLGDWDGVRGVDSLLFSNGTGDGGFPMSRGYDADGELVALIVWDRRQPWRLAVTDGTPPPDVTDREDQLLACMEGTRGIDNYGTCIYDE